MNDKSKIENERQDSAANDNLSLIFLVDIPFLLAFFSFYLIPDG
jgi:hypothetical protein